MTDTNTEPSGRTETYYLGGGCFWCLDAVYRRIRGVVDVVSGYQGGHTPDPHYREVCGGHTGHAEVVAVTFDPEAVPSDVILSIFFSMHDPTTLNRQGYDVGTQYRSVMFYTDEEQRRTFQAAIERHQGDWAAPIVTEVSRAPRFYPAEDIHQDFYAKNPAEGYCQVIINPKLSKARQYYAPWLMAPQH